MVIEPSVFVVCDDEQRGPPQRIVGADSLVDTRDQLLAAPQVVGRVIVIRFGSHVLGFNPREIRERRLAELRLVLE